MNIETFFDPATYTLTYLVWDPESRAAVVIDPVLDFDMLAVQTSTGSVDRVSAFLAEHDLTLHWALETHAHADHISGGQVLKERHGAKLGIGGNITMVQELFKGVFNRPDIAQDGSQFDGLFGEGDAVEAGGLRVEVITTPGHTPACVTYRIGDAIFTGDALFMPDFGTGRCDFPKGSAADLYASIRKLYALPDETRVFVGHDYQPGGRELAYETSIGASKASNKQLQGDTPEADFVKFRTERDAVLRPPRLIFQSIQANIDAGRLPTAEDNGIRYLKLPIGVL